jgi:hypothetical protein
MFLAAGVAPPIEAFWSVAVAANERRVFVRDLFLYGSGTVGNIRSSINRQEDPD